MLKIYDYAKMPVVDVVNDILVDASKRGASDIHFDPMESHMKIRIRIDGQLIDYSDVPNEIKKNLITRIKIISGMNITESRLPQDGAIKATLKGVPLDLRVSCLPTNEGEKIVIRILDYSMSLNGIESLGFSQNNYRKVLEMVSVPNGIILVTGATGSGKSTTVYSMLQRLNKEDTNIITVEDPIEMNIEGINQVQTNSEIGLTFASALRSILRQDPNVIMIGEIRDTETAQIAIRASITGHIVLSTLHTNDALTTIERLLDMEVQRYLLASALMGIISQKLARRLCPHCKKLRPANDYEKQLFKKILNRDIQEIYTNEGCDECTNGYQGRIAIHEVLLLNQEIRDAISSNIRKEQLRELVYKSGVTTLLQDGLEKVLEGYTTLEEILKLVELEDDTLGVSSEILQAMGKNNNSNNNVEQKTDNIESLNSSLKIDDVNPTNIQNTQSLTSNNNLNFDLKIDEVPINNQNKTSNNQNFDLKIDEVNPTNTTNYNSLNNTSNNSTINSKPSNSYNYNQQMDYLEDLLNH